MGFDKNKSLSGETQNSASLRHRAEEQLKANASEAGGSQTDDETHRLLHELQVHQIELEMQNEELRQARDEIETVLEQYTDLYDFAPVGYLTVARNGTICAMNLTGAGMLGIERSRLVNQRFRQFVTVDDISTFDRFIDSIFTVHHKETCRVSLLRERGQPILVWMEAVAAESGEECRVAFSDISERKRLQEALESKIVQLEATLARVKQLEGIIPICTYCKKIRDDQQNWLQLEKYITEHSDALFSHGACPECYSREMSTIEKIKNNLNGDGHHYPALKENSGVES